MTSAPIGGFFYARRSNEAAILRAIASLSCDTIAIILTIIPRINTKCFFHFFHVFLPKNMSVPLYKCQYVYYYSIHRTHQTNRLRNSG